MNNEIELLIKTFNILDCEFEVLNDFGSSIYQSNLYGQIKDNSSILEKNLVKYNDKYYEYSRRSIDINSKMYYINMYNDVTKYQNDILMLKEDALTTLPNRYAIELFLNNQINNDYITVICDLDDFKNINDTYGHPQGDLVLKAFGIILKGLLSQSVFVGRYGGEEFVMFFRTTNLKYVKEQLVNIRKEMTKNSDLFNDKYQIKLSSGICMIDKEQSLKDSIKKADIALYYVKNNGKSADAIYNEETNSCYIIE